jgi:hypothetical protein
MSSSRSDWAQYLAREQALFDAGALRGYREARSAKIRILSNRYFEGSPLYPGAASRRTGTAPISSSRTASPAAAVVLLHGLTDSPYSLRHIGQHYRDSGYVVVGIRSAGTRDRSGRV